MFLFIGKNSVTDGSVNCGTTLVRIPGLVFGQDASSEDRCGGALATMNGDTQGGRIIQGEEVKIVLVELRIQGKRVKLVTF